MTYISNYYSTTITEWCSDNNGGASCPSGTSISIKIVGFKNPSTSIMPTNSIKVEITTSAGKVVDSILTDFYATPNVDFGPLQGCVISKTPDIVGQSTTYTVQYTTGTPGAIATNGYIYIQFPTGFTYDTSTTLVCKIRDDSITTPTFQDISSGCTISSITDTMGKYVRYLRANLNCGTLITCNDATQYTFTVAGLLNPFSTKTQNGGTITVATQFFQSSNYNNQNTKAIVIGTASGTFSAVLNYSPGNLQINSAVRSSAYVDASIILSFDVTFTTRLASGGLMNVIIPTTQFYANGQAFKYQYMQNSGSYTSNLDLSVLSQTSSQTIFEITEWCNTDNSGNRCNDNRIMKFQITQGLSNLDYVDNSPTTYIQVKTYLSDGTSQVDQSTSNFVASPILQVAPLTVSSLILSNTFVAASSVSVDVTLKFGAAIKTGSTILMTFGSEFMRNDNGAISCNDFTSGTEFPLTSTNCLITASSNIVSTIFIKNFCAPCSGTSNYVFRFKNSVNRLKQYAFTGAITIIVRTAASFDVAQGTYDLTTYPILLVNTLSPATVTRSTDVQGKVADFVLTFTIPGILLTSSYVEVQMPLNQIVFQTGRTAFTVFNYANGQSLSFTIPVGSPSSTYNIVQANQWLCTSTNCLSGTQFIMKISSSQNPYIQSTAYNDFKINLKASDNSPIFTSPTPLLATPPLAYGVITPIAITHSNSQIVKKTTQYKFDFTIPTDVPINGKFKITFPPGRVVQYTSTTLACSSTLTGLTYGCTAVWTTGPVLTPGSILTVTIDNPCPTGCTTGAYSFTLIGGMKNPDQVPYLRTSFVIDSTDSNQYIIAEGKVVDTSVSKILPDLITVASVLRSSTILSAVSDYTVTFRLINALPSTGMFRIIIPLDQALTSPVSGPQVKKTDSQQLVTSKLNFTASSIMWVDIPQTCGTSGCSAGQTVQLTLTSMNNPNSFSANLVTSSWQIYTMTSKYEYIDGKSTGIKAAPDLQGKLVQIQTIELEDLTVDKATYLRIEIIPGSNLDATSLLEVYFPDGFAKYRDNNLCTLLQGTGTRMDCSFSNYNSGYISKVVLLKPCPNTCSEISTYAYQIPIQTRGDVYPVGGNFRVITKYQFIDVGQSTYYANSIVNIEDKIIDYYITNEGCDQVDQTCSLYLSFKLENFVPNQAGRGRVMIVMPTQVKAVLTNCQGYLDGRNTGTSCSMNSSPLIGPTLYFYHSQTVTIERMNVTIELQRMQNPGSTKPTDSIQVYSQWDVNNDGKYYNIDKITTAFTYNVTIPTSLYSCTAVRVLGSNGDQTGIMTGNPTTLQMTFQLRHALDPTASFIITLPLAAQVKINNGTSSFTCYSTNQLNQDSSTLLCTTNTTNRTITVRNYCQVASCGAKDTVTFRMYNDFINNWGQVIDPLNTIRDSLIVRTTTSDGGYYIDEMAQGVMVTPALIPNNLILPSPEITRDSNVISRKISWVINFKINLNSVPKDGYLSIDFPRYTMIPIQNQTIEILNYESKAQLTDFKYTTYPDGTVKSIQLFSFCKAGNGCGAGKSYQLLIDWIRNPSSQLNVNEPIIIQTYSKEGYIIERGITPVYNKLFSELIPIKLENLVIRPIKPVPQVITDYQITFTSDADFERTDILQVTYPSEISIVNLQSLPTTKLRNLQQINVWSTTQRCLSVFDPQANLTCTRISAQVMRVTGLFTNNKKQYGIYMKNITNPLLAGTTSGMTLEVQNNLSQTKAVRNTQSRINIVEAINNQSQCIRVCGACAGTNATCSECKVPSKYPIFKDFSCVDSCSDGYFFDLNYLQCFTCHHSCKTCFAPGFSSCYSCSDAYFMENGQCVDFCSKGLITNTTSRQCINPNNKTLATITSNTSTSLLLCNSPCKTCSSDPNYCLTCDKSSKYPVFDSTTGKCIEMNQDLCNNTNSKRFYIDTKTQECKMCSELCQNCYYGKDTCTACWDFFTPNKVNELYQTCVEQCGLGTYYNSTTNTCSYCNPVCMLCEGRQSDQCVVCNKTPEARQLYLYEKQCVIDCPKQYLLNQYTNVCEKGETNIISYSFLFMFATIGLAILLIVFSMMISKFKHKFFDVTYALLSLVEFLNRLSMLGNLWVKTSVFTLAICFMNLIATCAIGIFFNFLYMQPFYQYSPHIRILYKRYTCSYKTITALSYFGGINVMRLITSGFFGLKSVQSELNKWDFYLIPLNKMSNFTVFFTLAQTALNVYLIFKYTPSEDIFILACFGILLNGVLFLLQIFKHLSTMVFVMNQKTASAARSQQLAQQ